MNYDIHWLAKQQNHNKRLKYLLFWGHRPNRDGTIGSSCFSQWWMQDFTYEGKTFRSAEHWMMYQKALLFGDKQAADDILKVESPAEAKKLGRKVKNFQEEIWLEKRFQIVVEGNLLKFSQNKDIKTYLLQTGDRIIVEASPVDEIWGIGLSRDSEHAEQPQHWPGLNLLGFALMEVRDQLSA